MKNIWYSIILILVMISSEFAFSQDSPDTISLWKFYNNTSIPDSNRVDALLKITAINDQIGNTHERDRVFNMAINLLNRPRNHYQLLHALHFYLDLKNGNNELAKKEYARKLLEEASRCGENKCLAIGHIVMAHQFLREGKLQDALQESTLAGNYADETKDLKLIIASHIKLADVLNRQNGIENKVNALNIYLKTKILCLSEDDDQGLGETYHHLSDFYYNIRAYDSSIVCLDHELEILRNTKPVDSDQIQLVRMDLASTLLKNDANSEGLNLLNEVIHYAFRHHNEGLKNDAFQYYRNYYLDKNELKGIEQLYTNKYPDALKEIRDTSLFFRINAFICDAKDQRDSADYYYTKASNALMNEGNSYLYSYLQIFYGRFLTRIHQTERAISQLKSGFHALSSPYIPFTISLTREIENAFLSENRYDSAYLYRTIYDQANAVWDSSINGEALLRQNLSAQAEQKKLHDEAEEKATQKRHLTQYSFILLAIALTFLIFCLLSSFHVHRFFIRATGFFAFILLFEFFVLIYEKLTEEHTHGEPLYLLLGKIAIIIILTPLHHWTEEHVLHYFYKHKLIDKSRIKPRQMFLKLKTFIKSSVREEDNVSAEAEEN